ncbi:MAG: hypothetical protein AAGB12_15880 [Pseudomonadota bacterium]
MLWIFLQPIALASSNILYQDYSFADGDFTDRVSVFDPDSPYPGKTFGTQVGSVQAGSNIVRGDMGLFEGFADDDVFTFNVPQGLQVNAIILRFDPFGDTQGGSFFAIEAGTSIGTTDETVTDNLSNVLVFSPQDIVLTIDLLDLFINQGPIYGGTGLANEPLMSGDYTVFLSEGAALVDYSFDIQVSEIQTANIVNVPLMPLVCSIILIALLAGIGSRKCINSAL